MTLWQRRLRFGLGLFIIILTIVLVVSLRRRSTKVAFKQPPVRTDQTAIVESTDGRSARFVGGKQDVVVEHYDRMATYNDGRSRIWGGTFRILQRGGRDYVIKAKETEIKGQAPNVDVVLKGDVDMTSSDGFSFKTNDATYTFADGVLTAPGPVTFSGKHLTGSGVGMTFDKVRNVLWLLDKAVIHNRPDEKGEGGVDIEAGAAGLARNDHYLRFERGVTIVSGSQRIQSDNALVYLAGDDQQIQMVELRGSSRVASPPKAEGGLKGMAARDMNLFYGSDGKTLERAVLNGDGVIDLAGAKGAGGRKLSGQMVELGLASDGSTLTSLFARDRVQLDLLGDKANPARTIRAGALQGSGPPGAGLTGANFSEHVDFLEVPTPPASPRKATSAELELAIKNGFTTVESARFRGSVQFDEGKLTARAQEARYAIAAGTLDLAGADPASGRPPQVLDERATIQGGRLTIVLDGNKIAASESVKTEMRAQNGGSDPAKPGQPGSTRMPGILKQDKPVYATADKLDYDSDGSRAVYVGNAQLWQGETTIKGESITVDDTTGDLTASGDVVSRMLLNQDNQKTHQKEQVRSSVKSKDLAYEDKTRRAAYTGGAHMVGPEGDLGADRIDIYFEEGGNEIDHLDATGTVALKTPDGRRATGNRLVYKARDEQYDMEGGPVKLEDESGETTGNSLTFFRSTDRIIVDGKEQRRTELKRGIKR
jgi:lipopolysaccharide export system protein LptA